MLKQIKQKLNDRKGDVTTDTLASFLFIAGTFVTLLLILVYVMNYYSACYVCRRVVRSVEIAGEYDVAAVTALANGVGGSGLSNLSIDISDVTYFEGTKIQLQNPFKITLNADYTLNIVNFGSGTPISVNLPIQISMKGYSEVYWKSSP